MLQSWWRFTAVVGGAFLLLVLLTARSCGGALAESESAGTSSSLAAPSVEIEVPSLDLDPPSLPTPAPLSTPSAIDTEIPPVATEPDIPVDPLAVVAAEEFVRALLDTDDPDWPERAQSYVIPDRSDALETIDPVDLPAGSVQGSDVTFDGGTYYEVAVEVGDDEEIVMVEVTLYPPRWLVRGWR